jgi:hypothetical protein
MMKRLLRSYVYNGFVWELNCSTSGELNDDKSSKSPEVREVSLLLSAYYDRAPLYRSTTASVCNDTCL